MIINENTKKEKHLFLRDPLKTELGKNILFHSIPIILEIGFEAFTFKKLAEVIKTTESSIYRYFENKNKLLFYIISWYWSIIKYKVDLETINIINPEEKIKKVISIIFDSFKKNSTHEFIDEKKLALIVINEFQRCYLTSHVEQDYKEGLFEAYLQLCHKIATVLTEINPKYPNPKTLAMLLIRICHKPIYFSIHLPEMIDLNIKEGNSKEAELFVEKIILSTLKA